MLFQMHKGIILRNSNYIYVKDIIRERLKSIVSLCINTLSETPTSNFLGDISSTTHVSETRAPQTVWQNHNRQGSIICPTWYTLWEALVLYTMQTSFHGLFHKHRHRLRLFNLKSTNPKLFRFEIIWGFKYSDWRCSNYKFYANT